jgi:predicted DNA-binding transcriptional regulator AlpA
MRLVGLHEIASRQGVTKQRIFTMAKRYEDFPAPVAHLAQGRVWSEEDIAAWMRKRGRPW